MSSSCEDLGKKILAKLEQISAEKKNRTNSARSGSKGVPKQSTGSTARNTTPLSSDKPAKHKARKDRKPKQADVGSSNSKLREGKKASKIAATSPGIPTDQAAKSKQEESDQQVEEKGNSEDEDDIDQEVLLSEIMNLGGTEEDLNLIEGSPWKEVVIEEDHVADDELANDVKSFMKGLDFEAAMKNFNDDKESSPRPSSEGSRPAEQDQPSLVLHPKRKPSTNDSTSDTGNRIKKKKKSKKGPK